VKAIYVAVLPERAKVAKNTYNDEGKMRKKKGAFLAVLAPLFVIPAVVLLPNVKGSLFGLSPQFWSGFGIGLVIVLLLAAIAAMYPRKPGA
jgi:hypothetical protein